MCVPPEACSTRARSLPTASARGPRSSPGAPEARLPTRFAVGDGVARRYLLDVCGNPVGARGALQHEHVLGVLLARARAVERAEKGPVIRHDELRVQVVVRVRRPGGGTLARES